MKLNHFVLYTSLIISPTLFAQSEAGKTMVARGKVVAQDEENDKQRKLRRRSPIFSNDVVSTGEKSKAQLRMTDGGMIALKENSELQIANYQFSEENGRGSVVMELVKGGLRSVTGAIKAEGGDYKLKTPVGSIGIRGTHYEVEIVGSTIWVAVWDGAVDLDITTGEAAGSTLSLGSGEGYSYASIDEGGQVTTYVEPPETFEDGMSSEPDDVEQTDEAEEETTAEEESSQSDNTDGAQTSPEGSAEEGSGEEGSGEENNTEEDAANTDNSEGSADSTDAGSSDQAGDQADGQSSSQESEQQESEQSESSVVATSSVAVTITVEEDEQVVAAQVEATENVEVEQSQDNAVDKEIENPAIVPEPVNPVQADFDTVEDLSILELLQSREGSHSYNQLANSSVTSSAGTVNNFQLSMNINFDEGTVNGGEMSFDDDGGEWFAIFGGLIDVDTLALDVTFASHGDNLADGDIDADFVGDLDTVIGNFTLHEILNPDINVKGTFTIK